MNTVVKNSIWNVIGSLTYNFCQWLINILIVRISGSYEEVGILTIALSTSAIFSIISCFSVRPFQVADIDNKYSNGEYFTFRYITCMSAFVPMFIYLLVVGYNLYTSLCVIGCMIIRTVEYIADVTEGIFQKQWRLDLACRSMVIRGITHVVVFSVVEFLWNNLVISLFLSSFFQIICLLFFNIKPCYSLNKITIQFKNRKLINLFKKTLPLAVHGILIALLFNIPRLFANDICGDDQLGYYASVASPAYVVQLMTYTAFSPFITVLSKQYKTDDKKIFFTILKPVSIVFVVGVIAIAACAFMGKTALSWLFGTEILDYYYLLIPTVIVCLLIALDLFLTDLFVIVDMNITKIIMELLCVAISFFISPLFINRYGLKGINNTYFVTYMLFAAIGYSLVFFRIKKHNTLNDTAM